MSYLFMVWVSFFLGGLLYGAHLVQAAVWSLVAAQVIVIGQLVCAVMQDRYARVSQKRKIGATKK